LPLLLEPPVGERENAECRMRNLQHQFFSRRVLARLLRPLASLAPNPRHAPAKPPSAALGGRAPCESPFKCRAGNHLRHPPRSATVPIPHHCRCNAVARSGRQCVGNVFWPPRLALAIVPLGPRRNGRVRELWRGG
jgi:hypothetical protein